MKDEKIFRERVEKLDNDLMDISYINDVKYQVVENIHTKPVVRMSILYHIPKDGNQFYADKQLSLINAVFDALKKADLGDAEFGHINKEHITIMGRCGATWPSPEILVTEEEEDV